MPLDDAWPSDGIAELFLWILSPLDARLHIWNGVPYRGPIVVRAPSSIAARAIAAAEFPARAADGPVHFSPWLSADCTSCTMMADVGVVDGPAGLVSPPIAVAMACYGEDLSACELVRFYQSVEARRAAYAMMTRSAAFRPNGASGRS